MHRRSHRWLILLLVCILPLKAAIAAGGFGCHGLRLALAGGPSAHRHVHHAMGRSPVAAAQPAAHRHVDPNAAPSGASSDGRSASTGESGSSESPAPSAKLACAACAMGCSAPVLPAGALACLPPHGVARVWRDADAPAPPEHVPPGLERPPRAA